MDITKRRFSLALTLVLIGANLVALNYLAGGWSTARWDLTQERLYSISDATEGILTSLDENLTIHGYFSERTHPKLAPLVPEIADLLDEYRAVSRGKVSVEILDPGEDETLEEEIADRFGVRSTPFRLASKYESGIVNAFFALVVQYGDQYVRYGVEDLILVEPTPDGDIGVRLRNLEYDLTRAIKKAVHGFRSTNELFERIEQPARLIAIWTPDTLPAGVFDDVPDALRKAAEGLKEAGGDKFIFEEIDPSADERSIQDVYDRFGARPMSLGLLGNEEFYLYALLEVGGQYEQLSLTGESLTAASLREAVEASLRRYTPGFLKTVGVAAPTPPQIPPEIRMQMQLPPEPPPEFEEVKRLMSEDYEVAEVDLDREGGVPASVDVLLVLKPKNLSEQAVFHLDQYLMRGGRVIVCSSNYDVSFDANGLRLAPIETGLDDWLQHHGLSVPKTLVLDDRNQRLPIPEIRQTPFGRIQTWSLEPYPYLVQVHDHGFMNQEITASLDSVGIYWGSPLVIDEERLAGDAVDVLPILQSSQKSWTDDDLAATGYIGYDVPAEGTEPHLLAVALNGRFKSYFEDREPPAPEPRPASPGGEEPAQPPAEQATLVIKESPSTRLVVVSNAEFLSDFVARALSQVEGGFFVENLRFAQNLIDWISLDEDMIGIRARGLVSRQLEPLDRPAEITIEIVNYVVPALLLVFMGAYFRLRRRRTPPLNARRGSQSAPLAPSRHTEA